MTAWTALALVNPALNRSAFEAIYFEFRTIRPFELRRDRFEFRIIGRTECEIGGGRSRIAANATSCGSLLPDFVTREFPKSRQIGGATMLTSPIRSSSEELLSKTTPVAIVRISN